MRCFLGIALPEAYQAALERIVKCKAGPAGSKLSFTKPGNWHLTLKFLGETKPETLCALKQSLSGLKFEPFTLKAGNNLGFFPNQPRAKVIWLGLEQGARACANLAARLDKLAANLGYPVETRPFAAHLTIARLKYLALGDDFSGLSQAALKEDFAAFKVEGFKLWQSVLPGPGQGAPRYEVLGEYPGKG